MNELFDGKDSFGSGLFCTHSFGVEVLFDGEAVHHTGGQALLHTGQNQQHQGEHLGVHSRQQKKKQENQAARQILATEMFVLVKAASSSYLECRMKPQEVFGAECWLLLCVEKTACELFIPDAQTASDYFHFLNLNAEFKSTDNPINKIPRCKLMNPRIQQVFVIM